VPLFRNLSIRRSLSLMTTLASGAALLTASAGFIAYDVVAFRQEKVRRTETVAEILAYNSGSALVFGDEDAATYTLASLKDAPQVLAGAIYNREGRRFAGYRRPGSGSVLPEAFSGLASGHRFEAGRLWVFRPILVEGAPIGRVLIVTDLSEIGQRIRSYALIAGIVSLAAFAVALLVSARFQGAISAPILRLAQIAGVVSREKDYSVRATGRSGGEIGLFVDTFNEMLSEIQKRDHEISEARRDLAVRVEERTADLTRTQVLLTQRAQELETANRELEAFSYSVSHDLRAPLRTIDGFSLALLEDYQGALDEEGRRNLERVRRATQTMGLLIDDLLNLARVSRTEMKRETVDLRALAGEVASGLRERQPNRQVEFVAAEAMVEQGDSRLLKVLLENLLGNAWKFTSRQERARVELGTSSGNGGPVHFVRDNGAGFDMAYATKLFGAFQRLHSAAEFPGTGIGLATCARIVQRHGGRIWAESAPGQGATFFFTLGGER
jgi:signal transduction histidine kinase